MPKEITLGTLGGVVGVSFLLGITIHSFWPYQAVSLSVITAGMVIGAGLLCLSRHRIWLKVAGCVLLALTIGLWRFEMARPMLPRGLVPLSPRGLAYAPPSSIPYTSHLQFRLDRSRYILTERARKMFEPNQAALLTGIVYGERNFSKELKEQFRKAGLLHLVAVSGSNVTIIVSLVMPFLLACRLSRRFAFWVLSLALFFFVLFVNPFASVVRAAVMGWLVELAPLVGRIPRPSRLLLVAAVIFVFWQPWSLLFDASFALSFLAMWGLLVWTPWFAEHLEAWLPWKTIREITATSLGATLMTIPYTAWAFKQMSLFGIATSILALPLVPWIMILGILALLIPIPVFVMPVKGFLDLVLGVARLPEYLPLGFWKNLSTPTWLMLSAYGSLIVFWRLLQPKK